MDSLGEIIRDLRVQKGYTQEGLADRLYKTQEWVSRAENGRIEIKTGQLIDIASVLGVTVRIGSYEIDGKGFAV